MKQPHFICSDMGFQDFDYIMYYTGNICILKCYLVCVFLPVPQCDIVHRPWWRSSYHCQQTFWRGCRNVVILLMSEIINTWYTAHLTSSNYIIGVWDDKTTSYYSKGNLFLSLHVLYHAWQECCLFTFFWSWRNPYINASAVGGHPGT